MQGSTGGQGQDGANRAEPKRAEYSSRRQAQGAKVWETYIVSSSEALSTLA